MITKETLIKARQRAIEFYDKAGIVITPEEKQKIEIADFSLGELERTSPWELNFSWRTVCLKKTRLVLYR